MEGSVLQSIENSFMQNWQAYTALLVLAGTAILSVGLGAYYCIQDQEGKTPSSSPNESKQNPVAAALAGTGKLPRAPR